MATATRLVSLAQYDLLETPPEAQFDAIVATAAQETGSPIATIALLDERRAWFKARLGLAATEGPIEDALCAEVIKQDDVLVVPDARRDPRFNHFSPATGSAGIRFYAGAPLCLRDGTRIGTLCVIDVEPREALTEWERCVLVDLARRTVAAFELRRDLAGGRIGAAMALSDAPACLDQASAYLIKAWAALDQVGATAPLAYLEQVIADVDALRGSHR